MRTNPLVIATLMSVSIAAISEEPVSEFRPAAIATGPDGLLAHIDGSKGLKADSYPSIMLCQAYIERDGESVHPLCLRPEQGSFSRLRNHVEKGLSKSSFEPALVGHEPVEVLMNLMVVFDCSVEPCNVSAFPHHGLNAETLGLDYIAPQTILDEIEWGGRIHEWYLGAGDSSSGIKFVIKAVIDTGGRATSVALVDARSGWEREAENAVKLFAETNFIPGFYEGQPMKMALTDFWLNDFLKRY